MRLWVEIIVVLQLWNTLLSASLWGCELKYEDILFGFRCEAVSLLVRLWVEMIFAKTARLTDCSQPPCEAVSWNSQGRVYSKSASLSASLWGCELKCPVMASNCLSNGSASLWGCELKYISFNISSNVHYVSLLVRLWVEMCWCLCTIPTQGCQPPCEAVSWNIQGGKSWQKERSQPPCEAVSWNSVGLSCRYRIVRQPPCEAVSWNKIFQHRLIIAKASASLWGCELKWHTARRATLRNSGQPPCEAVSWNICFFRWLGIILVSLLVRLWVEILKTTSWRKSPASASLWGCELKCPGNCSSVRMFPVSLLVRLWVEIIQKAIYRKVSNVSLLVRLWVEMYMRCSWLSDVIVSLLVRLWVEIYPICLTSSGNPVSLLVRLWVEILIMNQEIILKIVSLLVRLWVEMLFHQYPQTHLVVSLLVRLWVEICW